MEFVIFVVGLGLGYWAGWYRFAAPQVMGIVEWIKSLTNRKQ